ncbi:hypothetical protein O5O45_11070 [Hahella aquimaris]|uniref:hypothetical protein n=1 Tax=Hahella sp. HNIBRBA332 TaxID=3015983 RepID=UPI00273C06FD|nr:hypothetical protein [Hahella sp. HNIBRBA332]WLQ16461.1 hypothetical protein O5O45_11070 [Hahella sp. HNIBRBA332]
MKVTFSWEDVAGTLSPCCKSGVTNHDGISPLCCLLTDNGGIRYAETVGWIEEGVVRADSVLNGETASSTWGREDWGALLTSDGAKIHSFYDENYFEIIPIEVFRHILTSWRDFLLSIPMPGEQGEIYLEIQ